ncbi:MAG: hypothetical protein JO353_12060 [Phycisphaerae bacterium]|nr:hypothetical protein [Phycisphaerae bacterium]
MPFDLKDGIMNAYRRIGAFSCLFISLGLWGCAGNKKQEPPKPTNEQLPPGGPRVPTGAPVIPAGHPDSMDTSGTPTTNPVSVLTMRTTEYSQSMQAAIDRKRPTTAPSALAPASQPTPQLASAIIASAVQTGGLPAPSQVQWSDPASETLSLTPGAVKASMQSTPSVANVSTTVAPHSSEPLVDAHANQIVSIQPPKPEPAEPASTNSLEQRLAIRVNEYPHDVSAQLDYELSRFVSDQSVPDLTTLSALPGEDSEMIAAVMDGLSNFRNNLRADANMLMSKKIAPLLDTAERLRSRSGLSIPVVRLCTDVYGFGNYKPFPGDVPHFLAGQEHQAILYCEVENFSSTVSDDKQWRTQLAQNTVLYSDQGVPEWRDNRQTLNDLSRSRRRDFFIVQKLTFSPNLPTGRYLMKVTVEDLQAQRISEATLPLDVEATSAAPAPSN